MLDSYLDSTFKNNKRVPLGTLIQRLKAGEDIPKGTLVVMASGDRRLRLKILEQPAKHKGFSEPLLLNEFALEHKVTSNYLFWYLSREPIANYLVENASGAVFLRVPKSFLHSIPVALPTRIKEIKLVPEFSVVKTNNQFTKLIGDLHNDYLLNVTNSRYRTAAILAGAICEVILYQMLIEHGVSSKLLKDDRSLGFNKLLDYIRILKLEENRGFPISQLTEIQKKRNKAIHAGLLVNEERTFSLDDLDAFDQVIKYFGL
jgi:hypothetical protein